MSVKISHKACADLLMDDYGVGPELHSEVLKEIELIWDSQTLPHCLIVASVRGYREIPLTRSLEYFLENHKTHEPKFRTHSEDDLIL